MIVFDESLFTFFGCLIAAIFAGATGYIVFSLLGGESVLAWFGGLMSAALVGYLTGWGLEKLGLIKPPRKGE